MTVSAFPQGTAAGEGHVACQRCHSVWTASEVSCGLCGQRLHARRPGSVQATIAFLVTAVVLYVPANVLPIMTTTQLGSLQSNTIIEGVLLLWRTGSYPTALVIFVASVLVPLAKMFALGWLCWEVRRPTARRAGQHQVLYQVTEHIGSWSMVDVFVVALLVALVQVGGVLTIAPGPAALAFCGVVLFTMLAASSFDSRLIWDRVPSDTVGSEEAVGR